MKFHAESTTLSFQSAKELESFHLELSALVRAEMVDRTRRIPDPAQAKQHSREVLKKYRTLLRALNALRQGLPRKAY